MIKRKFCVRSEINCSIKNAKAYFIPCDKTSQTSNLLVVYLLLEAKTVLSAEKMWHLLWREIDFSASLPWATCHSGSSVFQVINSFPNRYFWWSFSTLGPLNLASSPQLKQAWMFHSWMCKYLLPPQVVRKKNVVGHCFLSGTPAFTWVVHLKSQQWQAFFFQNLSLSKEIEVEEVHCGKEISLKMHFLTSVALMRNSYRNAGNWVSGKYTCSSTRTRVWRKYQ